MSVIAMVGSVYQTGSDIRATILFNVMNRCKYRSKLVVFCTIVVENWVVIKWTWNQVRNFGTGTGYAVPTKNHCQVGQHGRQQQHAFQVTDKQINRQLNR